MQSVSMDYIFFISIYFLFLAVFSVALHINYLPFILFKDASIIEAKLYKILEIFKSFQIIIFSLLKKF